MATTLTAASAARFRPRRETLWGLIFIAPGIVYFLMFWVFPVIQTAVQSLWRWQMGRPNRFVGLENYGNLVTDPLFINSVRASLGMTIGIVVVGFCLSFGLALLLNDDSLRGSRWFRLMIFLPVVTDWVATGMVWQFIFLPEQGVLPAVFYNLGLRSLMGLRWTATRELAPLAIIVFSVWKTTGLYTVILLAGLKSVPAVLTDAARVDGANEWQILRHVTVPLLQPILVFVIMSSFISAIGLFEPVFMLTGGGPADATKGLPLYLHEQFFQYLNGGYASAGGILFLLLCLSFAILAARQLRQTAYEE